MDNEISATQCEFSDFQLKNVTDLRKWIETEVQFVGRIDDEFLVLFLRGCKFNLEKAKKKMEMYYEIRKQMPHWWSNRNINEPNVNFILRLRITTALIDRDPHQPTVVITSASRFGEHKNLFDAYVRLHSILLETVIRRRNSQLNGVMWVIDSSGYPFWAVRKLLLPFTAYNIIRSFYLSTPVRVKCMTVVNTPLVATPIWTIVKPLMSSKLKNRLNFLKSDVPQLYDHVPARLLPEEYGGQAGPLSQHQEAFEKEVNSFNEYLLDDNKFGFQ